MYLSLPIVLASSSKFRAELLSRLQLDFTMISPDCDESPHPHEPPQQLAQRLATIKAQTVAKQHTGLIIGSDQVAWCQNQILGKPLSREKAIQTLQLTSNQTIVFYTALCVINTNTQQYYHYLDTTHVKMRPLSNQTIQHYLDKEPDALYCAGGAKSEGLGMSLIEQITSTDPNALIGLPIFALVNILLKEGYTL